MIVLPAPAVALAELQVGVIARWQLRRWLTVDQIDGLVQRGALVRLERGVYRVRGSAVVASQGPFAAMLRVGPPAVLTGPAVLGHLGVDGFSAGGPFEVLVRPGRRVAGVGFACRVDPRPSRAVTRLGGVRMTVAADALVHSVRWRQELGDRTLRLGCHWLGWRGHVDRDRLLGRLVSRAAHDPDAAALLDVLGGYELARCESDGEAALGRILRCFDPPPSPQVWLRPQRRTDWWFASLRLGVEYNGDVDHPAAVTSTADTVRREELAGEGVVLLHVTSSDLLDEEALVGRVAMALTVRALELGVPAPNYDPSRRARGGPEEPPDAAVTRE